MITPTCTCSDYVLPELLGVSAQGRLLFLDAWEIHGLMLFPIEG